MGLPKIGNRDGGAGQSAGHADANRSSETVLLRALRDELDDLRAKHDAAMVQLDGDAGVSGTTFKANHGVAAATFTK